MTATSALLEQALQHVESAANGHLPRGYRQAIWASLGPRLSIEGRTRRARLALLSALTTQDFWTARHPNDDFFAHCVRTVERLIEYPRAADAESAADAVWDSLLQKMGDPAILATTAVAKAVIVAVYDESFDASDLDITRDESEDFDAGDSAFFAAWVHCCEYPPRAPNPETLRQFWRWWLRDAVPAVSDGNSA